MPAYYASIVGMMLAIMVVYHAIAPLWLACGVPSFAITVSIVRGIWWTRHRADQTTDEQAKQFLSRATRTLTVTAVAAVAMDFGLFRYGDTHAHYFLLFQMLASAMCGFYSLMHLRGAALALSTIVLIPLTYLMLSLREPPATIAALTGAITCLVMVSAMFSYQKDFAELVHSKAESLQLSEDNLRLAHLDMLTDLPNRRHFFEMLGQIRQSPDRYRGSIAVGLIDLDGFKPVNDTYGHCVGDLVLIKVAKRLCLVSQRVLHLCRVGGDEFAFIVTDVDTDNEDTMLALGHAVVDAVSRPIHLEGRVTSVGCSVGFAISDPHEESADLLYERADYALYHAKRTGRGRAVVFSQEHATLIREHGMVEQTLRHADLEAEFYPLFQPIVDARTNRTLAFECLARWKSPALGNVSPGVFIPIAEHSGIITQLTPVLLRKALAIAHFWPASVHLSFNCSPYDIASLENTRKLISIIQQSGIEPRRISIELTETALLQNFIQTKTHMELIRSIGVKISLDDFGCGHSSLSYLHSLPLDTIKVDQSFVRDITSHAASKDIVRSLINLCRDMGLACVVEGVETTEQLAILAQLGANTIQGYFFAKPMSAESALAYLDQDLHPGTLQHLWDADANIQELV